MNSSLRDLLSRVTLGEVQTYANVSVRPLFLPSSPQIPYTTLSRALRSGRFAITEISEGGSVPDLRVVNDLDDPVLLLDGEELKGAKQNRVTNATILVDARGRLVIPVSCTEQGRWSYTSDRFDDSNVVMTASHRAAKSEEVRRSLERDRSFRSDQAAVWQRVTQMHDDLSIQSATGAMRDAYEHHRSRLEAFESAFPCEDEQRGLAVAVDGKIVGLDLLSRPSAYADLHPKLVQSYAMDAITRGHGQAKDALSGEEIQVFLERLVDLHETRHDSVGLGADYRYEGEDEDGAVLVGSALLVNDEPVHVTFFRLETDGRSVTSRMARYDERSRFRRRSA